MKFASDVYRCLFAVLFAYCVGTTAAIADDTQNLVLDLYKSESCGCCSGWQQQMESQGFAVHVHHSDDLNAVKNAHAIAPAYQSCHTGVSASGYVFEGHIPAKFIKAFLDNPPAAAKGLTVPGMPLGSPGMEMGDRFTPYDVLLLKNDGSTEIFAHIESKSDQY